MYKQGTGTFKGSIRVGCASPRIPRGTSADGFLAIQGVKLYVPSQRELSPFKYHVGINSLAQVATREDRVCVLNILGGESSDVTPVGHAWSGGNVVFGPSPGRGGQMLETPDGPIPV